MADGATSGFVKVLSDHRLLIFIISVVLFHFANAAMLPLVGQELSRGHAKASPLYMAVCIVGAQLVMIPVAMFAGRFASTWGRRLCFSSASGRCLFAACVIH